jgi:predicted nucleic acid-binding protein
VSEASHRQTLYVAEPRAIWLDRPLVVVDCSVLVALLFNEAQATEASGRLSKKSLHAPDLLPFEFANVASKKFGAGANLDAIDVVLQDFEALCVEMHPVPVRANVALARRYGLSCYDAAYLWLAAELKAPLVTFDQQLAKAAKRHLGGAS